MVEPKQKPAGKPVHTADKARIPRTAMRAAWLRTREGTRRLTAKEQQDGQYREAASLEERAADTAVSAAETAAGGHPARRQKAGTARCPKPPKGPRRKASAGTGYAACRRGTERFIYQAKILLCRARGAPRPAHKAPGDPHCRDRRRAIAGCPPKPPAP